MKVSWDASEVGDLVDELRRVPAQVEKRNHATGEKAARRIKDEWRRGAFASSRKHGKLYPLTIKDHELGFLEWKIEPDRSMKQGKMNFEYGGPSILINITPKQARRGAYAGMRVGQNEPHLDMNKTMDVEGPRFVEEVGDDMLPWF